MIPYGKHWIDIDDIAAVTNVLQSDFLTQGPQIGSFEKALTDYLGVKYAVAVANGTAALHLAVKALNLEKGKQGITSPNTFAASANCFVYNGLEPGFADIDENNYCLDPIDLAQKVNERTGVVIPVHFAGHPADMEHISTITKNKNIYLIEDASHAVGSKYENGQMVGSCCFADMCIFSFHPVKTIATGEGGAITTNSKDLYEKLILLRNHGITKDIAKFKNWDNFEVKTGPWYYEMLDLGFNYRMTDLQAALGTSQLKKIDAFIKRRREIVTAYNNALKNTPWLATPYERENVFSAFHLYVVKIDFEKIGKSRTQVMNELKAKGIGTQVHYIPVHLHPFYREHFSFKEGDFPKAEHYYSQCLSIPLYPKMTDNDIDQVIKALMNLN
ncbi:MAG: UDP-4-amino-4,6-dideoxy-N-acetyl-beta-L-altrosamine transaminase [Acidobacteria bacterium]|jgi:UDP-4-amino-4,6-dideoxy-N-acetyl-beta-L-altrosamine transaminase|nr:UDP-4-amino-4,6-dideoxy-N-acetyl-beta-L-altrosamine transaminase [Acidobacteriota bacterium]